MKNMRNPTRYRLLTAEEIDEAMKGYPRPIHKAPMIRLRYVLLSAFMTGLFSGLIIADPIARLVEWVG